MLWETVWLCLGILYPCPVYQISAMTKQAYFILETVIDHKPTTFSIGIAT